MIKYEGMKSEENQGTKKYLPVGAYVAKVSGVKIEGEEPDQRLAIVMDVAEGEYKGFFMQQFNAARARGNQQFPVKYKGVLRIRIPNQANKRALYPESDIRRFNDMIFRFEASNPGFHWEGDENKLVGLMVGISMQEASLNGNTFTKIARLESVNDVRSGLVRPMPPRRDDNQPDPTPAPQVDQRSGMQKVDTEQLPWEVNI